ncbi:MAG: DUF4440 domain-containing protein [bacterium]|nr:DUF4440 domain-containing protein [bacterium]
MSFSIINEHFSINISYFVLMIMATVLLTTGCSEEINIEHEKELLINTDMAFSRLSVEEGSAKAFEEYVAEDAVMYRDKAHPLEGKEAIVESLNKNNNAGTLKWKPFKADIAGSTDLGYTLGKWEYTSMDKEGNEQKRFGYYCSIWKKQEDGSWKWVYDGGVTGPPHDN